MAENKISAEEEERAIIANVRATVLGSGGPRTGRDEAELRLCDLLEGLRSSSTFMVESFGNIAADNRQAIEAAELAAGLPKGLQSDAARIVAVANAFYDALKAPVPMRLPCPACGELHIDEREWATKPHHTHACQNCGEVWRPSVRATVGVRFLPGFKNETP